MPQSPDATKPLTLTSVENVALSHQTDFLRKGSVYMRVHHIFYRLLSVEKRLFNRLDYWTTYCYLILGEVKGGEL